MSDTKSLVTAEEFFEQLIAKLGDGMEKYVQVHELDGRLVVLTSFEYMPDAPVFSVVDDLAFEHGYRHNCSITAVAGVNFGTSVLSR